MDKNDNSVPVCDKRISDEVIKDLEQLFQNEFNNQKPDFFVKTPGRVNLIGEHIDYCGYPVLPMAIEQNITIAVAASNDEFLQLRNVQTKYKAFKCTINNIEIKIEDGAPEWYKYFLCGVKGVFEDLLPGEGKKLKGMLVLVSGSIPPASGLSSSSALVSAAVCATAYCNGLKIEKQELANVSANCERYIGTQGGGMDQAIAYLAKEGCAQYIEWNPLRATSVNLPKEALFVIANSLAEANKAATSDFNQRVVECRLGCRLMAKKSGINNWKDIEKFSNLQKCLNSSLEEMESLANESLKQEVFSKEDLLKTFEIPEEEFSTKFLTPNTRNLSQFLLKQRALHVFQEAIRVEKFKEAAAKNDLDEMSNFMKQSHSSLKTLYECSHENLDELVSLAEQQGVNGARLTGAGWGGSIIVLCKSINQCHQFIENLKTNYYHKKFPKLSEDDLKNVIFVTNPKAGAEIVI